MNIFYIIFLWPVIFGWSLSTIQSNNTDDPFSHQFSYGKRQAEITDLRLRESSGMVVSRKNDGLLWVHNDSGNQPRIFLIDTLGEIKRIFYLKNAVNYDWEDIAIGPGPSGKKNYMYVGDIGDNLAVRPNIQIYRFEEPSISQKDSMIVNYDRITLNYPDSARDAEALMVDPISTDIYIISKREPHVGVYKAKNPSSSQSVVKLEFLGKLPFHLINAADITPDGKEILVKNYLAIFYWKRDPKKSIFETLQEDHQLIRYSPEPQGESIAWKPDDSGFYTISERVNNKKQFLYYYPRNQN